MVRRWWIVAVCVCSLGSSLAMAEPAIRGFGFGGPLAMAFFPDMTGINVFMSENGLPPMGEMMIGAGGNGRGGIIGGATAGGIGWGTWMISEAEDRRAELAFGGGGLDLGVALGGNDRSVLALGAVLGGGANVLTLSTVAGSGRLSPSGIVPEPSSRAFGCAVGFVQPYVSMAVQPLPWVGLELRLGYILPVFGVAFGDLVGIPIPSLRLSGPTVSFGVAFGGIGSASRAPADVPGEQTSATEHADGAFAVDRHGDLMIDNALGSVVITSYTPDASQTSSLIVRWQAVRTSSEPCVEAFVEVSIAGASHTLATVERGRTDYTLSIPAGVDLRVHNAIGEITLVGHEAMTIILETGVGEVRAERIRAAAFIATAGIGDIELDDVAAQTTIVRVGLGSISVGLPASTSATLMARTGIGDVAIDRFPAMTGGVHGFLGKSGDVVLGFGANTIELKAGIGRIDVQMYLPVPSM